METKVCSVCGGTSLWNGEPLNLISSYGKLFCPNCHSQENRILFCCDCGKRVTGRSERCAACNAVFHFKIQWPDREKLAHQVKLHGFYEMSRRLGVADTTIRQHLSAADIIQEKECEFCGKRFETTIARKRFCCRLHKERAARSGKFSTYVVCIGCGEMRLMRWFRKNHMCRQCFRKQKMNGGVCMT